MTTCSFILAWNIPIFLPEKFHGQSSLGGYKPKSHKESDMTGLLSTTHIKHMPNVALFFNPGKMFSDPPWMSKILAFSP